SRWEPCYHVLRLSIKTAPQRELVVTVETRVWRDKDKRFGPHVLANGEHRFTAFIPLPARTDPPASEPESFDSPSGALALESGREAREMTSTPNLTSDAFAAARRKLIVHFFRLGTLSRYEVVIAATVWEEGDDAFDGQARWARVFERAERNGK